MSPLKKILSLWLPLFVYCGIIFYLSSRTITAVTHDKLAHTLEYGGLGFLIARALDGTEVGLRESFVPVGGTIVGTDGSIMVNDFVSMEIANTHPNCRCSLNYKVVQ